MTNAQAPRIAPLRAPYAPSVQAALAKWMPPAGDLEPLRLFHTLVVHEEWAPRFPDASPTHLRHTPAA
jgi:hypothetical protein